MAMRAFRRLVVASVAEQDLGLLKVTASNALRTISVLLVLLGKQLLFLMAMYDINEPK